MVPGFVPDGKARVVVRVVVALPSKIDVVTQREQSQDPMEGKGTMIPMVPGFVPEGRASVVVEEIMPLMIVEVTQPSHPAGDGVG